MKRWRKELLSPQGMDHSQPKIRNLAFKPNELLSHSARVGNPMSPQ
jgi:hypothetical protein